jgi:hypothetical protein
MSCHVSWGNSATNGTDVNTKKDEARPLLQSSFQTAQLASAIGIFISGKHRFKLQFVLSKKETSSVM